MEWTSSPSRSVWRKRVHLADSPESGQVTSVVRYLPNSSFPAHDHPEGEEILELLHEQACICTLHPLEIRMQED